MFTQLIFFNLRKYVLKILENNPKVIKTLNDDEPEEMQIHFYSSILINYTGVNKPEHGSLQMILKFDKFFNVDVALNGQKRALLKVEAKRDINIPKNEIEKQNHIVEANKMVEKTEIPIFPAKTVNDLARLKFKEQ